MKLKNGFYIGKDSSGYFIWNEKDLKRIKAEKLKEAIKEAEK